MGLFDRFFTSLQKTTRLDFHVDRNNHIVQFKMDPDNDYQMRFDSIQTKNHPSRYVLRAETFKCQSKIFRLVDMEFIELNNTCEWRSAKGSAYEYFLKREFSEADFRLIKRHSLQFVDFAKYRVGENEAGVIWVAFSGSDLFIFDQYGRLFNDMLDSCGVANDELRITKPTTRPLILQGSITARDHAQEFFLKS